MARGILTWSSQVIDLGWLSLFQVIGSRSSVLGHVLTGLEGGLVCSVLNSILHYHWDNGRFADNAFKNSCSTKGQQLTFCGVNAHFLNGIVEKAIRDLWESVRKQLLHVRQCWPATIHLALWPYALRRAVNLHNTLPVLEDGTSRLERFSSIRNGSKMKYHHAFGCPVFALENDLAAGSSIPHWSPRTRLGVDLGSSPSHARNFYLVLSLHTGCVSPQYHFQFDDFFETVRHGGPDVSIPSAWQQLSGLTVMTQTPSMEHHDGVPHHSQRMQFGNHPVVHSQESEETILFGDTAGIPIFFDHPMQDFNDDQSVTTVNEGVIAFQLPLHPSHNSADLQDAPSSAGTSLQGRVRKMSKAMAESVSQRDFYGKEKMHYMVSQAVCKHDYDHLHDSHLDLQDCMPHPISFLAEMMGDVMYLHQVLRQPDSKELVEAIIKEGNGHVDNDHWKLILRMEVPEGTEVVPSV